MLIFIEYPIEISFEVEKTFSSNEERTQYLRNWLEENNVDSPCHDYSDYHVEGIVPFNKISQYWIIGS